MEQYKVAWQILFWISQQAALLVVFMAKEIYTSNHTTGQINVKQSHFWYLKGTLVERVQKAKSQTNARSQNLDSAQQINQTEGSKVPHSISVSICTQRDNNENERTFCSGGSYPEMKEERWKKKKKEEKNTKLWHHQKVELHSHKQHLKSPWTSKGWSWKICRLIKLQGLGVTYGNFYIEIILRNSKPSWGSWECIKITVHSDYKVYKYQQCLQKFSLFF